MKIIEIISDTNIGGAGVLLVNRLKNTDLKKYQTAVALPKGSMLTQRLLDIGVRCIEIDCRGDSSLEVGAIAKYVRLFKKERPDIINCHGALSARIAAKVCRVPIKICTRHCVFSVKKSEKVMGFLNNMLSDRFIAVAHSAKENLKALGVDEQRITVIINGAEPLSKISEQQKQRLRAENGIDKSTFVLAFCARLEECKGHEWFFKAVRLLIQRGENIKVLLIGDGSQRQRLEAQRDALGISESIIFCGFVTDVSHLMNIADLSINCSVGTETSSLALSEGMSLGLPAVVSDYGGNPYMIRHGENGFVVRCGDYEKMAEYIVRFKNDKTLYKKTSLNARKRFEEELNAVSMTEKTNSLYDMLYEIKVKSYRP
ncbi:MAG: glycosyltransferase [Clostridia bacterium]|nr:glycosyltransferase [Clostridia bacterium]